MLDLDQARAFLSALSSHDDGRTFAFQTFSDKGGDELNRTFHGTFDETVKKLVEMNEKGAGVFVCVNRTNGRGVRGIDVDRIRSFFIDDDDDHLDLSSFPLEPSIVVRSKAGNHVYWLLKNGVHKDTFAPAQKALSCKYDTDRQIHNLNRVMRIPGFLHHKEDPYLVEIEQVESSKVYELDELVSAFDLHIDEFIIKPRVQVDTLDIEAIPMERRLQRARGQLRAIGPAIKKSGTGHEVTLAACRVANDFAIPDVDFIPELLSWGASCEPPWEAGRLERFYQSTTASINSGTWPWGGKLLDSKYTSDSRGRAPRVTRASMIREDDVPWIEDANSVSRLSVVPDIMELPEPPVYGDENIPEGRKRRTALLEIVDAPKLPPVQAKQKQESRDGNRIGADIENADADLPHDDSDRDPRDISWLIEQEYIIRRDDSRCIYIYRQNYWQETSREFIEKLAMQYMSFAGAKMKKVREAAGLALTRRHIQQINWNQISPTEIVLENGILDFMTGEVRDHDPENYVDRVIPFPYDPEATCPLWKKCLQEWLPGMDEEIDALQQFFGYILMSHARYKKAMILFGKRDTGKSQVCNVATTLVGGNRFVCSVTPDEMDDPRKRAPLKGKALNVVADLKKNTVLADGGFKQLVSTGDPITIDQKYTRSEMYTPTAKHLFATNNLPTIVDVTDAVFRRIMILKFMNQVPLEKQDTLLDEKLRAEMPGILMWAIRGAQKLYSSGGRWPTVASSEALIDEYKLNQNPLFFYIKESGLVEETGKGHISTEELRNSMNEFNGTKPYGRRGFAKLIDGVTGIVPSIKRSKYNGSMVVKGLAWTSRQTKLELIE